MNKKKLITLLVSLGLIGAVGIGATLAYFTDRAEVTNAVTMGNVDIVLTEESSDANEEGLLVGTPVLGEDNETVIGHTYNRALPLDVASKEITVSLAGTSEDARIRLAIDLTGEFETGTSLTDYTEASLLDAIDEQVDKTIWSSPVDENGVRYYYLINPLSFEGTSSAVLIEKFTVPNWDNSAADQSFTISVVAEAVQNDNFNAVDPTTGIWTEDVDIQPYN